MKIFVLVAIALFAYASAQPLEKKVAAPACQKVCAGDYAPVCGKPAEGKGTDITFGNNCVMENYNCEKKDKPYVKALDGECEGKAPVRL